MKGDYKIGEYLVSPSLNTISRNGTHSHVEPKAMQVLGCLAENAGEVVSKERLIQTVWANTHVTDDVLTGSVSALRKAFDDSARKQRTVQTIPKGGYRLVAPVHWANGDTTGAPAETQEFKIVPTVFVRGFRAVLHQKWVHVVVAVLLLAIVGTQLARLRSEFRQVVHPASGSRHAANPAAYQLYLKGRHYWNTRTKSGLDRAIVYFQQAIHEDPSYALAYVGLADAYNLMDEWGSTRPRESFPRARAAAMKALELDDSLAEAHTSLAYVMTNYDWEWTQAEKEFQTALKLKPNYAVAHQWYAMHLASLGRFAEATAEIQRAQELDPLSPIIGTDAGEILYAEGRYLEAIEEYNKTLEFDPTFLGAHAQLARAYERLGRYRDAVEELQKANRAEDGAFTAALGRAYATSGYRGVLKERIAQELDKRSRGQYGSAAEIASYYLALGETNQALDWLQKARDDRDSCVVFLTATSDFDTVRENQRFGRLFERPGRAPLSR